jgi:hypothetical protein
MSRLTVAVILRALGVRDNHNGTFTVELPARTLTPDEARVLRDLFPHLRGEVDDVLAREALLAALAPPDAPTDGPAPAPEKAKAKLPY